MAGNQVFAHGEAISVPATDPVTPASGDPIIYGQLPGVSVTAERADGTTSVRLNGIWNLSVKGVTTAAANSAVAVGDLIYYVPGNTPKLSKAVNDAGAVRFGYALDPVNAGATATIRVKLGW
jgi:predicted RecA/RadA family phage recombinase